MSPSRPFVTVDGETDTAQVPAEAVPLAKPVALAFAAALVPGLLVFAVCSSRSRSVARSS